MQKSCRVTMTGMLLAMACASNASDKSSEVVPTLQKTPKYELIFEKWKIQNSSHRPGVQECTIIFQRLNGSLLREAIFVPEWGDVQIGAIDGMTTTLTSHLQGNYYRSTSGALIKWSNSTEWFRAESHSIWDDSSKAQSTSNVVSYVSQQYWCGESRCSMLFIQLNGNPAPIPLILVNETGMVSRGKTVGDTVVAEDWRTPICPDGLKGTYSKNGPMHIIGWQNDVRWERLELPHGAYLIFDSNKTPRQCWVTQHTFTHIVVLKNEHPGSPVHARFVGAHRLRIDPWGLDAAVVWTGKSINLVYSNNTEWQRIWTP